MKRKRGWLLFRVACLVFLLGTVLPAIPAQAQSFAYVANPHTSTVSVIDTVSDKVVANVADVGYA
jgi:YVTN family beta-propeller protein